MIIQTKRLILREYTMEDFDALCEIITDAETMKYYLKPYDRLGVQRWLEWSFNNYKMHGFGLWAMELKETGEFIGDCGLTMQSIDGELLPEIGYHINKQHWRNGYAKEAACAVRDWAFENTKFEALYSYMNVKNIASSSTASSVGMTRVKDFFDGEEHLYAYSITREEWHSEKYKGS